MRPLPLGLALAFWVSLNASTFAFSAHIHSFHEEETQPLPLSLPPRHEPLYDLALRLKPSPSTLARTPLSLSEWQAMFREGSSLPLHRIARWKLGLEERLPAQQGGFIVSAEVVGYPAKSNWATPAKGTYRLTALWALGEQALLEVSASDVPRREGINPSAFDTVPLTRLTWRTGEWEWQFARAPLRWQGGYSGALLVNDEIPPVPYLQVGFPLRIPLLGTWQFEQFLSEFRQEGRTVWWGGRRFQRNLGDRWSVSLSEAFKALSLPDGITSQLVPYYLYQKWLSDAQRQSGWLNYLAEVGIQYQWNSQEALYLFWLIDDMRAPDFWGGRGASTPRKTALLVGTRLHPTPETRLIVEVVRTDGTPKGGVYGDSGHDPRYAYTFKGLSMGHPFGANQIGLYARLDYTHKAWLLTLEGTNRRRFHPQYLGERGYEFEMRLVRQLSQQSAVGIRYRTRHLRNNTLEPDARCGWWIEWWQCF